MKLFHQLLVDKTFSLKFEIMEYLVGESSKIIEYLAGENSKIVEYLAARVLKLWSMWLGRSLNYYYDQREFHKK